MKIVSHNITKALSNENWTGTLYLSISSVTSSLVTETVIKQLMNEINRQTRLSTSHPVLILSRLLKK